MLKKLTPIAIVLIMISSSLAGTVQEPLQTGRAWLFDGTLTGIRQGYAVFDDAINDPNCIDCQTDRELLFFHALSRIGMWFVGDDAGQPDSIKEFMELQDVEVVGDTIYALDFTAPELPENRYGQKIPPANFFQTLTEFALLMDQSGIADIEDVIAELNQITETPENRFRVYITPQELSPFTEPGNTVSDSDVEVDYADVMMMKGLLTMVKAWLTSQNAYDTAIDEQDRLGEKIYEDSFSIQNDLLLPHPDFLKVLPTPNDPNDGAAILAQSRQDIITALQYYLDTFDYIENEDVPPGTDPQDDELLALDPDDQYVADTLKNLVEDLLSSLQNDTTMTADYYNTREYTLSNATPESITLGLQLDLMGQIRESYGHVSFQYNGYDCQMNLQYDIYNAGQLYGYGYGYNPSLGSFNGNFYGTLSPDYNDITNASFEYWGSISGNISDLSGSITSEVADSVTINPNPIFGDSTQYPDPVNPRDLFCDFDEWNLPTSTMAHSLGDDPTLGGILPDFTNHYWQLLINPQPSYQLDWQEIEPWQILNGWVDLWLPEQLILSDPLGDLHKDDLDRSGVDIHYLYIGYDWDYLHGCIVLDDIPDQPSPRLEIVLSYSPNIPLVMDSMRIEIAYDNNSASGNISYAENDNGYVDWHHVDSIPTRIDSNLITFKIPFYDIPGYISGRYITVNMTSWSTDKNPTHIQVGETGSISGIVNFPGYRGGPIFVQAYTDIHNPEESIVAYTMLDAPGEFTLDNIGLGWEGYIRAFTPMFGQYYPADMEALKAYDIESVFLAYSPLQGIELNLTVPPVLEKGIDMYDSFNTDTDTEDFFAFDAVEGATYTLELFRDSAYNAYMSLLDRNGDPDNTQIHQTSYINWVCDVSGRYYVRCYNPPEYSPISGTYRIRMTSNINLPAGDISGPQWAGVKDAKVDLNDMSLLATYWMNGCAAPYWCDESDFDQSGTVDLPDLLLIMGQWMAQEYPQ